MKKYSYDKKAFGISVTFTGVFCAAVGLYSLAMLLQGNSLFWFVLLICIYQVYNTFVSISNPETITISEESIIFSAYGHNHIYRLDEISAFHIKELDQYKKMYVRVNDPTMKKGRYWIACGKMNDGKELWEYFAYLEFLKEPEQLKFRARTPANPMTKTENTDEESLE